jgi:hypothetical protein
MKITNKKFAQEFLQMTKEIFAEVSKIDANSPDAKNELDKAQTKVSTIKQANNIFRSCLQHDVSKAKIDGYESSFLDNE